jgi:Predicted membrane protein (DUF2231)
MTHLVLNAALVVLYSVNPWIRTVLAPDAVLPVPLSVVGVAGLLVSGWLGGEMVYVHRVGVAQGEAHSASRASGLTSYVAIPEIATHRSFRTPYSEATWVGRTVFTGADVSLV